MGTTSFNQQRVPFAGVLVAERVDDVPIGDGGEWAEPFKSLPSIIGDNEVSLNIAVLLMAITGPAVHAPAWAASSLIIPA